MTCPRVLVDTRCSRAEPTCHLIYIVIDVPVRHIRVTYIFVFSVLYIQLAVACAAPGHG
jgi:hypothetical protein